MDDIPEAIGSGASAPLLLVYQMGKVASRSWVALGQQYFGIAERVHVHYMSPESLAFLRGQYEAVGSPQTMLRRMPLRILLQSGERARASVEEACARARPVLLVTGMRDPIARSVSLLFFLADFTGRRGGGLSWRDGAAAEDVERALIAIWEQILAAEVPQDTFGRMAHFTIGAYRFWFEREVAAMLGVDIMQATFAPGPARRLLTSGGGRTLIYRVEDMSPESPGHALLRADLEALSGKAFRGFPKRNVTDVRRSGDFYRAFRRRLRMPARLVDRIYDDPVVRRFYSPQEIARFRQRWSAGSLC